MKKFKKLKIFLIIVCAAAVVFGCTFVHVTNSNNAVSQYDITADVGDYTGLVDATIDGERGEWYVKDGWIMYDYTGFVPVSEDDDMRYYYIINGQPDRETEVIEGEINGVNGYWYMINGVANLEREGFYNTTLEGESGWYYVEGGKIDPTATGLFYGKVSGTTGTFYVKDGKVDFSFEGFVKDGDDYKYVINGREQEITGLIEGTINGVSGIYYVNDGVVMLDFTGFIEDDGELKYIENGKFEEVTGFKSGMYDKTDKSYYVENGIVQTDITGFVETDDGYLYMKEGQPEYTTAIITGTVDGTEADWYVKDGYVQTGFSGVIKTGYDSYSVENGMITGYIEPEPIDYDEPVKQEVIEYDEPEKQESIDYDEPVKQEEETKTASSTTTTTTTTTTGSNTDNNTGSNATGSGSSSGSTEQKSETKTTTRTVTYNIGGIPCNSWHLEYINDVWAPGQYMGRLTIPTVGIDVAVYHDYNDNAAMNQWIGDQEDSACYIDGVGYYTTKIGDHDGQGFKVLRSVNIGDYLYLDTGSVIYRYQCVRTGTGQVDLNTSIMYDENGKSLNEYDSQKYLCVYTCLNWPVVTYTIWQAG